MGSTASAELAARIRQNTPEILAEFGLLLGANEAESKPALDYSESNC
jgi:hypothetical protein